MAEFQSAVCVRAITTGAVGEADYRPQCGLNAPLKRLPQACHGYSLAAAMGPGCRFDSSDDLQWGLEIRHHSSVYGKAASRLQTTDPVDWRRRRRVATYPQLMAGSNLSTLWTDCSRAITGILRQTPPGVLVPFPMIQGHTWSERPRGLRRRAPKGAFRPPSDPRRRFCPRPNDSR